MQWRKDNWLAENGPCPAGEDLSAYLDGELSRGMRLRVARHLRHCRRCQEEFRLLQEAAQVIKIYPEVEISLPRFTEVYQAAARRPAPVPAPAPNRGRRLWGWTVTVGACLFLGILLFSQEYQERQARVFTGKRETVLTPESGGDTELDSFTMKLVRVHRAYEQELQTVAYP